MALLPLKAFAYAVYAKGGPGMKGIAVHRLLAFFFFAAMALLSACSNTISNTSEKTDSFTTDKTFSYDKKYYALQNVEETESGRSIKVTVYSTDMNKAVAEFTPARASDFWGICWESDTYNIWIQSGDAGVLCYACQGEEWTFEGSAERPSYIISKYD